MQSNLTRREELAYRFYINSTTGKIMPVSQDRMLMIDAFKRADEFIELSGKDIYEEDVYNKLRLDRSIAVMCAGCGKEITDFKSCVVKTNISKVGNNKSPSMVTHAYCPECKPVK